MKKNLTQAEEDAMFHNLIGIYGKGPHADRFARFGINVYKRTGKDLSNDTGYNYQWVKRFNNGDEYIYASGSWKQALIDADGKNAEKFWKNELPEAREGMDLTSINRAFKNALANHERVMREENSLKARNTRITKHKPKCMCKQLSQNFKKML